MCLQRGRLSHGGGSVKTFSGKTPTNVLTRGDEAFIFGTFQYGLQETAPEGTFDMGSAALMPDTLCSPIVFEKRDNPTA